MSESSEVAPPRRESLTPDAIIVPPAPRSPGEDKVMSLVDHLSELRRRLAISIMAVIIGSAIGFVLADRIILVLLDPLPGDEVQFLTITGGFAIFLRISLIVGILLALPVILYQLWAFVAPGLTPQERRAALPWIPMSIVFFLLGSAVAYLTLPYAISFLLGFQIADALVSRPSAEHYFGFVTTIFIVFGAVMQFPTALVLLSKLGILSVARLRAGRRYALVGIVIFSVVITPGGDPVSPIFMSTVMYLLFEGTILLLRRSERAPDG